ncbi:7965_t:CDS:2 [Paraglomus brasilianum]|uniref:7965_t:CDS:1 n=1 Tax=Paraglomus brasilianum TaxID=144538 RepID=A0A9N9GFH7_9GLOM|nr:7965_t:CDS:2 [Paraglomus brasilianum]
MNSIWNLVHPWIAFQKKRKAINFEEEEKNVEYNKIKIFIGTWNMHGKLPPPNLAPFCERPSYEAPNESGDRPYCSPSAEHPYHLLVIGTQECQHNISHSVFFPSKEIWENRLCEYLGHSYKLVKTETMAALHLAVFVWNKCVDWIIDIQHASVATGIANLFGNKGAVGISILFGYTSFLFINSHLAANKGKLKQRNCNVKKIQRELKLKGFNKTDKAQDVTDRFDYIFWFGDMNYRVNLERAVVDEYLEAKDIQTLLEHDQLLEEMKNNTIFKNFHEAPIGFTPTFKFDITDHEDYRHSGPIPHCLSSPAIVQPPPAKYDTSEKNRVPSWTDRILFKTRIPGKDARVIRYTSHMDVLGFSDHRPVTGVFLVDFDWNRTVNHRQNAHPLQLISKKDNSIISYFSYNHGNNSSSILSCDDQASNNS